MDKKYLYKSSILMNEGYAKEKTFSSLNGKNEWPFCSVLQMASYL